MIKLFFSFMLFLALTASGCASLLPSSRTTVKSPWDTFGQARATFDQIIPYSTAIKDLNELGYDPYSASNIKILTYLDIMNIFMPNPSISKETLDKGIQWCIEAKLGCMAYRFEPQVLKSRRYGNFLLDLFNFKRKSRETGWKFSAIVVLVNNPVVYKLWSGNPAIDEAKETTNPLGPLQGSGDLLIRRVVPGF